MASTVGNTSVGDGPASAEGMERLDFDFEKYYRPDSPNEVPTAGSLKGEKRVCRFFLQGGCGRGFNCIYRHSNSDKIVVCKHWLRSLCKKGDRCEFLHEFDMDKMPDCWFFSKYGECRNPECLYVHADPNERNLECPNYMRGFCKLGPICRFRHVQRTPCINYLSGFCPEGPNCQFAICCLGNDNLVADRSAHVKYELPLHWKARQDNKFRIYTDPQGHRIPVPDEMAETFFPNQKKRKLGGQEQQMQGESVVLR